MGTPCAPKRKRERCSGPACTQCKTRPERTCRIYPRGFSSASGAGKRPAHPDAANTAHRAVSAENSASDSAARCLGGSTAKRSLRALCLRSSSARIRPCCHGTNEPRAATAAIAARQRLLQLPARRLPTRATAPCRRPWSALTASFQRSATRSVGGSTARSRYPERSATRSVGGSTAQSAKQRSATRSVGGPCARQALVNAGQTRKTSETLQRANGNDTIPPIAYRSSPPFDSCC